MILFFKLTTNDILIPYIFYQNIIETLNIIIVTIYQCFDFDWDHRAWSFRNTMQLEYFSDFRNFKIGREP